MSAVQTGGTVKDSFLHARVEEEGLKKGCFFIIHLSVDLKEIKEEVLTVEEILDRVKYADQCLVSTLYCIQTRHVLKVQNL